MDNKFENGLSSIDSTDNAAKAVAASNEGRSFFCSSIEKVPSAMIGPTCEQKWNNEQSAESSRRWIDRLTTDVHKDIQNSKAAR